MRIAHLHWEEPKMVPWPSCERCVGCKSNTLYLPSWLHFVRFCLCHKKQEHVCRCVGVTSTRGVGEDGG